MVHLIATHMTCCAAVIRAAPSGASGARGRRCRVHSGDYNLMFCDSAQRRNSTLSLAALPLTLRQQRHTQPAVNRATYQEVARRRHEPGDGCARVARWRDHAACVQCVCVGVVFGSAAIKMRRGFTSQHIYTVHSGTQHAQPANVHGARAHDGRSAPEATTFRKSEESRRLGRCH